MQPGDLEVTRTRALAELPTSPSAGGGSRPLESARIGRYTVLRALGEGGMGVVYAAYDEQLDRKVAIKLLHGESSGGTQGRSRIFREAQALARLSHPNVVQVHEVGEHEGQVYVAMELVDGVTLAAWLRAEARPLAAVVHAYHQAGLGLEAAHRVGLVHRDFKPDNVLVGADGRVRVADFGLARAAGAASPGPSALPPAVDSPLDSRMTITGAAMGTPAYMSPEQFAGGTVDARSDIFSFSVSLWEAVHGERPFAGDTIDALARSVRDGDRRPPRVQLPVRLAHALERGLAREPDARWPTMRPLLDALAVDPSADPSGVPVERRMFGTVMITTLAVLLAVLAATLQFGAEDAFRGRFIAIGLAIVAVLVGLALALRRSLLRNAYYRKVVLFMVSAALVGTSQRVIGLLHGLPLIDVLLDSFHLLAGMSLVAAICFARWFAVLAVIAAVAVALGAAWPEAYPAALFVVMPAFALTFVVSLRRAARTSAAEARPADPQ
ncbi:Serine/threonine protein kinase [Nannocystis exedens]|uniref:Serine/threonine protein kinase n=1 Tax=Nannocystis exedens TaxID=54 RepID=A0A1I1Z2D7_9BACT|nr:serine/threonine-protein kinase [Nannocystis exedens]PCC75196.1 Serine/threonine-protein kinase PK-1 [Nannocystis exedens]SFE25889.1 Serine/threonine protein kinase [Nannocystis exedens]